MTGICEYVTFRDKGDFADMIKLSILRQEDCPTLSYWATLRESKKEMGL